MNVFEAIGMLWVIFTSALCTVAIGYLAMVGLRSIVNVNIGWIKRMDSPADDASPVKHVEVKESFKVAH